MEAGDGQILEGLKSRCKLFGLDPAGHGSHCKLKKFFFTKFQIFINCGMFSPFELR